MRSKLVSLGFQAVNTKTGELYSAVVDRRGEAMGVASTVRKSGVDSVAVQQLKVYVSSDWQRGDSLDEYLSHEEKRALDFKPTTPIQTTVSKRKKVIGNLYKLSLAATLSDRPGLQTQVQRSIVAESEEDAVKKALLETVPWATFTGEVVGRVVKGKVVRE